MANAARYALAYLQEGHKRHCQGRKGDEDSFPDSASLNAHRWRRISCIVEETARVPNNKGKYVKELQLSLVMKRDITYVN